MVSGRGFTDEFNDRGIKSMVMGRFPALDGLGIIVNESAAKWMNKEPDSIIGDDLRVFTEENGQLFSDYKGKVVGVVKDYHTENLKVEIAPTVYIPAINSAFDGSRYLLVKGIDQFDEKTVDNLRQNWNNLNTGLPFDYSFLDESIESQYRQEARISYLLGFIALMTLVVSAMGLLGLSIFTAETKKKEIGIKKVLGASVMRVVNEITGEFLLPVFFSLFIALPLGYYIMGQWLDQFAFKIQISLGFFVGSAAISIVIAYLTVSLNSFKTALSSPIEAIKNE